MTQPKATTETPAQAVHIIDDDEAVRDAVGLLLDSVGIPHITHESADAFLAATDLEHCGVLVLDVRMPGMSGLALQALLQEQDYAIPIIFITGHGDIPMAVEAMRQGAFDFLRKPFRDQELLDSIDKAQKHQATSVQSSGRVTEAQARIHELTPRERDVFEEVTQGKANKVIAIDLGISERTVEIHRAAVMQKTQAKSLADLVRLKVTLEQAEDAGNP